MISSASCFWRFVQIPGTLASAMSRSLYRPTFFAVYVSGRFVPCIWLSLSWRSISSCSSWMRRSVSLCADSAWKVGSVESLDLPSMERILGCCACSCFFWLSKMASVRFMPCS